MTLINNHRRMVLEIVQRSEAPKDAWRNFESHYRAKGTREILRLSHEVHGKAMQPGDDPFQFMMEIDRSAADPHRLGDISVTELRKCMIVVAGLPADYEIEIRMLESNPTGLERAEIERVVGNQYNRLLRQQQDSKALSASKGATSVDRERITGDPATDSRVLVSTAEGRVAALRTAGVRRRSKKNQEMPPPTRRAGLEASATSVEVKSTLRINTVVCAEASSTGTRDCEERGAEKDAMLAKMNVVATIGAARGDGKEE